MGCRHSKEVVETMQTRIKIERKSKKLRESKGENARSNQPQPLKEETQVKSTHYNESEEIGDGNLPINELICDGIAGKMEYFSRKESEVPDERGRGNTECSEENESELQKVWIDDGNNRVLSIEEIICDGISGETEYYSPKGSNDDWNGSLSIERLIYDEYSPTKLINGAEDREVLVEEKTEEVIGDGKLGERIGFFPPKKSYDRKYFSVKEKKSVKGCN